nr:hypothetical protein Iba_chr03dCG3790 [Ipomoea batatas]
MPPRQRKKSVAQKPARAEQPAPTPLYDPNNFERYKFFSEMRIFQPYILSLDVAEHFGIRDEVEEMVSLPEWNDLMSFGPVQQLTEEERDNRVANVPNTQEFWEEITDGTSEFRSSHNRSTSFIKREHKFMQYLLSHSVCGQFDATSFVNHADLFCLYGMVKRLQLHVGVIFRATQQIILVEPKAPGMQLFTAEAVERMREKIGAKKARTADATDERMEEEAYDAHLDAAGLVHAGASQGSSSGDFQQQVLAQLAAMNMKVDKIYNRMDDMEAANAQSRDEARAYYEWMKWALPTSGGPQFPPFDPSFIG